MIESIHHQTGHGIRIICQVLDVPRSSYYHASKPTSTQDTDLTIGLEIEIIFKRHRRRYGYRRIHSDLADKGIVCAASRVRRIMDARHLRAIQPKTYVPKTSDGRADKPSLNLLLNKPLPEQPNKVWAGDITYIPVDDKWLYLAVIIDLHSRRIVGWALANHMRAELVTDALRKALSTRRVAPDLIFHSGVRAPDQRDFECSGGAGNGGGAGEVDSGGPPVPEVDVELAEGRVIQNGFGRGMGRNLSSMRAN